MRYSKQREAILRVVNASNVHPTAEMVYREVKKEIPNISLGTVYRNLNALADASQIKRIRTRGFQTGTSIRYFEEFLCICF